MLGNNSYLNNEWITEEIKIGVRKYFELESYCKYIVAKIQIILLKGILLT